MQIGLIGGLDRNGERLTSLAAARGHRLVTHTGRTSGPGHTAMQSLIERCELVIVQTDINSHGAVWRARALARERGRPLLLVRRLGVTTLGRLLDELQQRTPHAQAMSTSPGASGALR